jgi:hypothetical protein
MRYLGSAAIVIALSSATSAFNAVAGEPAPSYIRPEHAAVIDRWLQQNPSYRTATDADCSCDDDIRSMRKGSGDPWKPHPDFHPYYVVGDFNWDGTTDFAVGVVLGKNPERFKFVIFHGPFSPRHSAHAAFVSESFKLGQALFFGDPRPLPHMLLVGPFETEGAVLRPSVKGYAWVTEQ